MSAHPEMLPTMPHRPQSMAVPTTLAVAQDLPEALA